ncbi:hypothetical protein ACFSQZ_11155 [Rubritalea spongiae]|uniref:Uncharacterized protein n=1 Tax=Rubritalea spongiae TaxID=430797 RepID=A0ABW5E3K7_9BACT
MTVEKAESNEIDKYMSDVSYQIKEDGSVQTNSNKRSSFEHKANYGNIRQQSGSNYYTESYSKKGWSQNKEYDAGSYYNGGDGSKYQKTPHFAEQQSRVQGEVANAAGQGYESGQFYGGSQTVSRGTQQSKQINAATQVEQDSFVSPPIKGKGEAQQMSVDETNWMLGR